MSVCFAHFIHPPLSIKMAKNTFEMLLIHVFDLIRLCPASMLAKTSIENIEEPRILILIIYPTFLVY
jgi:hypothetical protein